MCDWKNHAEWGVVGTGTSRGRQSAETKDLGLNIQIVMKMCMYWIERQWIQSGEGKRSDPASGWGANGGMKPTRPVQAGGGSPGV